MSIREQLFKTLLLCLPFLVVYSLTFFILIRSDTGDDRTLFGILFDLPLLLLSMPWSSVTGNFEPSLRDSFSINTINKIAVVYAYIAMFINAYLSLKIISFSKLIVWAIGVPAFLLMLFLGAQ